VRELLNLLEILELNQMKSIVSLALAKIKKFDISLVFNSTDVLGTESRRIFMKNFLNEEFLGCEKEDEINFLTLFEIIGKI
jgi:hypothetical protein